jgi:hypothetical protein
LFFINSATFKKSKAARAQRARAPPVNDKPNTTPIPTPIPIIKPVVARPVNMNFEGLILKNLCFLLFLKDFFLAPEGIAYITK